MQVRTGSKTALLALLLLAAQVAACDGKPAETALDGSRHRPLTADVAELEIRGHGPDRFKSCPPPGELGQHWIPQLPAWTPPVIADAGAAAPVDQDFITRTHNYTPTEQAIEATHRDLRSCYRKGLVHAPTQDGRVAIVLRVGADGRVAKVETHAACELVPESLECMQAVAARLRFPPPANGSDTITIPAVFTSRDGVRRTSATPDDAYTAGAYLTIESARPALHACEEQARKEGRPVEATATFTLDLRSDGSVVHAHIDPWTGDQALLVCGARVLERLRFKEPPAGTGTVLARINFNPRQGTR